MKKNERLAAIDIAKYMKRDKTNVIEGSTGAQIDDDQIMISVKLLPKVYKALKGYTNVERTTYMAAINSALISYLDRKGKEVKLDYMDYSDGIPNKRLLQWEVERSLPKDDDIKKNH